jgi:hypothetical protein
MSEPGIDALLLDVLHQASSLDLYRLSGVIDRMLADPRRILAVRRDLHMGQVVRFLDWRDGRMRTGRIVAMKDTQVTLHEDATRTQWKLPYVAIEPPAPGTVTPPPPAPAEPPKPTREDFRCGEKVAFEDRYLNTQVGVIMRINERTATIDTGDGTKWRVGFGLLRHVLDI